MLHRIRAALVIGVLWAVVWAPVGAAVGAYEPQTDDVQLLVPTPLLGTVMWFALGWGVMGAISGFLFALTLALAERGRTIATLSMGRVALWGGVGALVLPLIAFLVFLGIFGSHGMYIEFIPILSVVGLGTACSTTILWLGRRGSESPAGSRPAA